MRYFEIVRPSAGHISTYTDAIEAAPGEPLESGIWKQSNANDLRWYRTRYQSAVTSAAFITPAFAIAQGSFARATDRSRPSLR